MSIIRPEDFVGTINIVDAEKPSVAEPLQICIDKYEKKYLRSLLGNDLYLLFKAGIEAENPEQKWINLLAEFNDSMAGYIYYHWVRQNMTYTNRTGTSTAKNENAEATSPAQHLNDVWNDMVETNWDVVKNWNSEVYGAYYTNRSSFLSMDIFRRVNVWNLWYS